MDAYAIARSNLYLITEVIWQGNYLTRKAISASGVIPSAKQFAKVIAMTAEQSLCTKRLFFVFPFSQILNETDSQRIGTNGDSAFHKIMLVGHHKKQPRISKEALDLCDKCREKKGKRKPVEAEVYNNKNKEVRTKLREDKEIWIKQQCETLETEITKNNTKRAFDIVKKLTRGHIAKATIIEDKNDITLTDKCKVADRWREYCGELYTCN